MCHFTLFLWLRKASAFFGLSDYPTTVTKLISSQPHDQVLSIGGHQIVVVGHRTLLSRQYIEYVMHGHEPHVAAILPLFCCFLEFHCCTGLVQAMLLSWMIFTCTRTWWQRWDRHLSEAVPKIVMMALCQIAPPEKCDFSLRSSNPNGVDNSKDFTEYWDWQLKD